MAEWTSTVQRTAMEYKYHPTILDVLALEAAHVGTLNGYDGFWMQGATATISS